MAASEGLLPSLLLPLCASFGGAVGEAGLRSFAVSLPLVTTEVRVSIGMGQRCRSLLALTLAHVHALACVVSILRSPRARLWVRHSKFGQKISHVDVLQSLKNMLVANVLFLSLNYEEQAPLVVRACVWRSLAQRSIKERGFWFWLHKDLIVAGWPGNEVNKLIDRSRTYAAAEASQSGGTMSGRMASPVKQNRGDMLVALLRSKQPFA